MNDRARRADVIDFLREQQWRQRSRHSESIAELALDMCEEMFQQRDWKEFARWHAIYCRTRCSSQNLEADRQRKSSDCHSSRSVASALGIVFKNRAT
jgi:hypothetical protein